MVKDFVEKKNYFDEEVNDVRMGLCILLCWVFFVKSRSYLPKHFVRHVMNIDGLHRKNWAEAILRETMEGIEACQDSVREHGTNSGKNFAYVTKCPLELMVSLLLDSVVTFIPLK